MPNGQKLTNLGMQYVPLHWQCSFPKDRIFATFLTLIRRNPEKKVFVHCRVGDDRTGMMIAAYRMAEEGWTARQAREEMVKYGFSFAHRCVICPRLSRYEGDFPKRFATRPEFEKLRSIESGLPGCLAPLRCNSPSLRPQDCGKDHHSGARDLTMALIRRQSFQVCFFSDWLLLLWVFCSLIFFA